MANIPFEACQKSGKTPPRLLADSVSLNRKEHLGLGSVMKAIVQTGYGSPEVLRLLNLVYSGALVQAGLGNLEYADLSGRMDEAAGVIFGGRS